MPPGRLLGFENNDMTEIDLDTLSLRAAHAALRDRRLTATALAAHAAERHAAHDYQAYITWSGEQALTAAAHIDALLAAGYDSGPLMGLPVSVKDLFAVPNLPTYAGSAARLPAEWERPGPVMSSALAQLALVMGKTHTVEFAFGGLGTNAHWGTPRNPWDPNEHRVPGGSSSGAGVSLVEGSALLAFGTDTAGSVRIPAAMTGTTALKTTAGRWPKAGIVPLSSTLDTPGILANTVDDLAFAFDAIDARLNPALDRTAQPLDISDLRLGVPETFFWEDCSPGVAEAVQSAIDTLARRGARIVKLELPRCQEAYEMFRNGGVAASELAAFLRRQLPDHIAKLDPNVAQRIAAADALSAWEYVDRRALLESFVETATEALAGVHALLTPTVAVTPPTLGSLEPDGAYAKANMLALRNTMIGNFMGLAGLTLPVGKDAAGMPVGLQLLGAPWSESQLLATGCAVERVLGTRYDILGRPASA